MTSAKEGSRTTLRIITDFLILISNDTHREICVLLNSVEDFIEIKDWPLLTFFLFLHNQLFSLHSIVAY